MVLLVVQNLKLVVGRARVESDLEDEAIVLVHGLMCYRILAKEVAFRPI